MNLPIFRLLMTQCCASINLAVLVFLTGCAGNLVEEAEAPKTKLHIPKWSFVAKISTRFVEDLKVVPKNIYVFPAIRLSPSGQPIDALTHCLNQEGGLEWQSPAPAGAELKSIVEKKLKEKGFRIVAFSDLTNSPSDRKILVFNIYYAEASASKDNPTANPDGYWTTFTRITASTFSKELNPRSKQDIMNQEMVTLFNRKKNATNVIKSSSQYLLEHIGVNKQWSESINLL